MNSTLRHRTILATAALFVGALFGFSCGQLRSHQLVFGTRFGSLCFSADNTGYAFMCLDASDRPFQYKRGQNGPPTWDSLATWQMCGVDILNRPWVLRIGVRHSLILSSLGVVLLVLLGWPRLARHARQASPSLEPATVPQHGPPSAAPASAEAANASRVIAV